jgi:cation transport regulator ChaB
LSDEQVQSFLTNETVPEEIRSKLAYAYNSFNKNTYNNQIQQQLNNNNSLSTAYKTSANKFVKMANEIINAPSKEDGSYGIVNYGKGFWNTLRDRDTFTLGISELLRDNNLRLASNNFKKWYEKYKEELINKGDKDYQNKATQMAFNTLANDDKQLINSYMLYNNMAARRGIDLSKAYNAGGATAQSVEFMTEMMIGSGIAGGIKNAVKTGVKKFTTRGIKEEAINTAKNTVNNAYVQGLKDYASKTLKPF